MCKIAAVTGITNENRDNVWLLMMTLGDLMSVGNSDGLGYAAFDQQNRLFGERWLHNNMSFTDLSSYEGMTPEKMEKIYHSFGEEVVRDQAKAIILHTRMATCAHGIKNAHPHVDDMDNPQAALIHNGVIMNHHKFKKKYSSCDSEVMVHQYMDNKVGEKLNNLSGFTGQLSGWFTCLVLSKNKDGRPILDIFTDSRRLFSYKIPELGVTAQCTSSELIKKAAETFNWTVEDQRYYPAESAYRLCVDTGETLDNTTIPIKSWSEDYHDNVIPLSGNFDSEDFWSKWLSSRGE